MSCQKVFDAVRYLLDNIHISLYNNGKGLTSWLFFVMFNCVFVTFSRGILGQVWYLIVSIPDLCHLSYFNLKLYRHFRHSNGY